MTPSVFNEAMAYLSGFFGELTTEKYSGYKRHLSDLTDDHLRTAVKKCVEDRVYSTFPSVADIRYYAGVDMESVAKMAIVKLKRAISKISEYKSISFSDKALNAVVNHYGKWTDIKTWTEEDWGYKEKAIRELYISFIRSRVGEDRIKGHDEVLGHEYKVVYIGEIGESVLVENKKEEQKVIAQDFEGLIEGIITNIKEV